MTLFCPDCGSDGPHTMLAPNALVCNECGQEFGNPFWPEPDAPGADTSAR